MDSFLQLPSHILSNYLSSLLQVISNIKETINFIYLGNLIDVSIDNSGNAAHGLHPRQEEKIIKNGLV